jgi:membrane-associated phospholipid phosphatase
MHLRKIPESAGSLGMLNVFDTYVMTVLGHYAHRSPFADNLIIKFLGLSSVKLLPLVTCLWLLWFSKSLGLRARTAVVQAVVAMFTAVAISRLIQNFLPNRLRPLHSGDPHYTLPFGVELDILEHWSSFPSDHAALIFALSTIVWRVSRPLGAACYAWSLLVVCLPRVYAGYHYASDILGAAFIGILTALIICWFVPIKTRIMPLVSAAEEKAPTLFYAAFFVLSYQFTTMFDDARGAFRALSKYISW